MEVLPYPHFVVLILHLRRNNVQKVFAKTVFTSEQLLGEYFHLELCKQHKTAPLHIMKQNLHGNWDHPLHRIEIGTAACLISRIGDESGFCDRFL